jgi:hypothetical protein
MWGEGAPKGSDEEEEESSEEESSEDEGLAVQKQEMTREERRAAAKAKKEAAIAKKKGVPQPGDLPTDSSEEESDDDMPANPNHSSAARKQATAAPVAVDEAAEGVSKMSVKDKKPTGELSRREREALEKQQARERYMKLHEAGKTDEAKADLARLKLIREKREAEAARKQVGLNTGIHPLSYILTMNRLRRRSAMHKRRLKRPRLRHVRRSAERQQWVQLARRRAARNEATVLAVLRHIAPIALQESVYGAPHHILVDIERIGWRGPTLNLRGCLDVLDEHLRIHEFGPQSMVAHVFDHALSFANLHSMWCIGLFHFSKVLTHLCFHIQFHVVAS